MAIGMVLHAEPVLAQHELQPLYDSLFQTKNILIHGKEYNIRYPQGEGHPFFGRQSWRSGFIQVHQMRLAHDAIRYDLLNDHLLIQHFSESGSHVIMINKDYAGEFHLDGHRFCFLEGLVGSGPDLEPGYYEAVYGPGIEIWARWKKTFSEGSQGSGQFEQTRTFFIKNRDHYYQITNRKSLISAFPGMEDDIKSYLKKKKIPVRRAVLEQLVDVVKYYEGLLR